MSIEHPNVANWGFDLEFPIGWSMVSLNNFIDKSLFQFPSDLQRGQLHDLYFHVNIVESRKNHDKKHCTFESMFSCKISRMGVRMFACAKFGLYIICICSVSQA